MFALALTSLAFACQDPAALVARLRTAAPGELAAAAAAVEAAGEPALKPLRALRDDTKDADLRARIEQILGGIELQHPGGLMLAFTRGETTACELYVWQDGHEVQITHDALMENEPALAPDGKHLAYARAPHHHDFGAHPILLRELASGKEQELGKGRSPCWSRDGTLAIARGSTIALRQLGNANERSIGEGLGELSHLQWSPNGRFLAAESKDGIVVLEAATGAMHVRLDGTPPDCSSLYNFSLGDSLVAMVSGNGPYDWDVFVTAIADGAQARKLTRASFRHGMASLSPDASCLLSLQSTPDASGYAAYVLDVREEAEAAPREVFASASPLLRASWSPEGRFVVFASADETLQLLHVRSGRTRALAKMQVGYGSATVWFAPSVWFANGRAMPKVAVAEK